MPGPESPITSKGWAKHERTRIAQERRDQPLVTLASWETVSGMIDLRTRYNPDINELVQRHRPLLKLFYDGWFDVAAGRGRKRLNTLSKRYTQNPKSKYYNPELIDSLAPYISMIRDSFPETKSRR